MARKTKEDTQKTVIGILDAAEKEFLERGVANTTISNIAGRAGVSKGAVYGHYKDKLEICVAVCMRGLQDANHITTAGDGGSSYLEKLFRWGMSYLKVVSDSPSLKNTLEIMFCKCEQSPEYEPIQKMRYAWEKRTFRITETMLARAAAAGEIPEDADLKLCNIYLQSLLDGVVATIWFSDRLEPGSWPEVERLMSAGLDTIRLTNAFRAKG